MNKKDVYKILDIQSEDNRDQIKSKLGLFRLEWAQKRKNFSEKEMDEIAVITGDIINNDIKDDRDYAMKMDDLRKDMNSKNLIDSIEKDLGGKTKKSNSLSYFVKLKNIFIFICSRIGEIIVSLLFGGFLGMLISLFIGLFVEFVDDQFETTKYRISIFIAFILITKWWIIAFKNTKNKFFMGGN